MRVCTRCATSSDFGPNKARPDGLQFYCRECVRAVNRLHRAANPEKAKAKDKRHAEKHAEKKAAATRAWRAANLDRARARDRAIDPEKKRASNRATYLANREDRLRRAAEYREKNRERIRAGARAYGKANPDVVWRSDANRRARERAAFVDAVDRTVVYRRDAGICGLCLAPVAKADASVDHIVPLSRGGEHSYANVQIAHLACNLRKGNRVPV